MSFVIGAVVGYFVGTFAGSNILLPLLWALPLARRLNSQGELTRPIPLYLFCVAPVVWSVIICVLAFACAAVSDAVLGGYVAGVVFGVAPILNLVRQPNQDMFLDFRDTYGRYLRR